MHGVGNDFLVFDRGEVLEVDLPRLARLACDRHFGVGADGILVPEISTTADLKMVYLNSDGSVSEMCGNGIRCLARYAHDHRLVDGESLTIETESGVKKILLHEDGSSRVDVGTPVFNAGGATRGLQFSAGLRGQPARGCLSGIGGRSGRLGAAGDRAADREKFHFPERLQRGVRLCPRRQRLADEDLGTGSRRDTRVRHRFLRRGGGCNTTKSRGKSGSCSPRRRYGRDRVVWRGRASLHDGAGRVRVRGASYLLTLQRRSDTS